MTMAILAKESIQLPEKVGLPRRLFVLNASAMDRRVREGGNKEARIVGQVRERSVEIHRKVIDAVQWITIIPKAGYEDWLRQALDFLVCSAEEYVFEGDATYFKEGYHLYMQQPAYEGDWPLLEQN